MKGRRVFFAAMVGFTLMWASNAIADTASQETARAKTFVRQGNLRGALQAYTNAARADRTDQQLVQQVLLVRRAAILHQNLGKETNQQRWVQMAQALRSFYSSQGALELNRIVPPALARVAAGGVELSVRHQTGTAHAEVARRVWADLERPGLEVEVVAEQRFLP